MQYVLYVLFFIKLIISTGGLFYFRVKFYVSDPSKLQEEYTRYYLYLQLRKDILNGKLIVSPSTACLLASYTVQCNYIKLVFKYRIIYNIPTF